MSVQLDEVIGKRVVVDYDGVNAAGERMVLMLCECGDTQRVRATAARGTTGCRRCCDPRREVSVGDYIGQRLVLDILPPPKGRSHRRVILRCVCGRVDERILATPTMGTRLCRSCSQREIQERARAA